MPIYTFRCQKCGKTCEISHAYGEPHPKIHAGCGGVFARIFDAPAIIYRGSGFYSTDKALEEG